MSRTIPARCGIAEYVSMLGSELRRYYDLDIIFLGNIEEKDGFPQQYIEPYSGIETRICFSVENLDVESTIQCIKKLGHIDIIHIQHEYSIFPSNNKFLELLQSIKRLGSKVVVTLHTVVHALKGMEYVEFQRRIGRIADVIVVHSILQEYELIMQGVDPRKIVRIPHGTLLNPFTKVRRSEILKKLGIEVDLDGFFIISTPGFIRRDKGLDILLKTFNIIKRRYDVKMVILGEPQGIENYAYANRIAEKINRMDGIIFINRFLSRDELLLFLSAIDLAIFPYRDEYHLGVSGAFHLAIGSFKPVVCTKAPRLVECYSLAPSITAPIDDPEELAKKVELILEKNGNVEYELKNLKKYAFETSWNKVAEIHRKLYLEVLEY